MFTNLLIKKFINNHEDTIDPDVRSKYAFLEGWVSIFVNIALFIGKLIAGLLTGSISLIVDAVHSLSDLLSSIAIIWGIKISATPPDKEHPFGHGRMEHVTTLIIAILLIVTGFEFLRAAFLRILNPEPVFYSNSAILVVILSILLKEWLSRFSKELGKRIDSKVLEGDAIHHRTDAITSLLVLVALFSEKIQFPQLDSIIGILMSTYIMYSGWDMVKDVVSPLLGESATYDEVCQLKTVAMSFELVKGVHDITIHKYGNVKIISMHVEIPEEVPVMDAHNIVEDIEEIINNKMVAYTVIHLDPIQKMNDELRRVHDKLKILVHSNDDIDSYHDVRIVKAKKRTTVIFDVVTAKETCPKSFPKLSDIIVSNMKLSFPDFDIKVWVEPKFHLSG